VDKLFHEDKKKVSMYYIKVKWVAIIKTTIENYLTFCLPESCMMGNYHVRFGGQGVLCALILPMFSIGVLGFIVWAIPYLNQRYRYLY